MWPWLNDQNSMTRIAALAESMNIDGAKVQQWNSSWRLSFPTGKTLLANSVEELTDLLTFQPISGFEFMTRAGEVHLLEDHRTEVAPVFTPSRSAMESFDGDKLLRDLENEGYDSTSLDVMVSYQDFAETLIQLIEIFNRPAILPRYKLSPLESSQYIPQLMEHVSPNSGSVIFAEFLFKVLVYLSQREPQDRQVRFFILTISRGRTMRIQAVGNQIWSTEITTTTSSMAQCQAQTRSVDRNLTAELIAL